MPHFLRHGFVHPPSWHFPGRRASSDDGDGRAANAALICAPAAKDVVERVHQPERTERGRGVIINCRGRRGFAARQRIARNTHTFLVGLFGRYSETEREGCWNRENTSERRRGRGSHAVVEPAARSGRRTAESGIRESRKSALGPNTEKFLPIFTTEPLLLLFLGLNSRRPLFWRW